MTKLEEIRKDPEKYLEKYPRREIRTNPYFIENGVEFYGVGYNKQFKEYYLNTCIALTIHDPNKKAIRQTPSEIFLDNKRNLGEEIYQDAMYEEKARLRGDDGF